MKTLSVVLCCLCASVAWGQSGAAASVLNSEPQMVTFHSHRQDATQTGMGHVQRILERSTIVSAHGKRPLWEVAEPSVPMPLGDVARLFRQEHAMAKKAERVWISN